MNTPEVEACLEKYRNLAHWSDQDWRQLDVFRFIAANWRRYAPLVIKRVGAAQVPSDILEWLQGIFVELGHAPLTVVHQRHQDETGERRNQVMLGTLKAIAATRVVEAVIEEFPLYVPLDTFMGVEEDSMNAGPGHDDPWRGWPRGSAYVEWDESELTHPAFLWNPDDTAEDDGHDQDNGSTYDMNLVRIEWLRSHLTPSQYRTLHLLLVEGLDFEDIAAATGVGVSNVRIMMLHARERLLALLPADVAVKCEDLRKRKRA